MSSSHRVEHALLLRGEQIVVEVDVIHAEIVAQVLHVIVDVLRGVDLVQALEHGAVAERTGVGTAARGDHRRALFLHIGEQRQVIGVGKTFQLFVGGKRQFIQIQYALAARIGNDALAVAIHQIGYLRDRHAVGVVEQRALAFADTQIIDLGEVFQQRRTDGRCMHVAEQNLDIGAFALDVLRHVHRIHETGSGGREADHIGVGRQRDFGIFRNGRRCERAETVMHESLMPVLIQPGRKRQDADGWHAVGQYGEIRLTGNEVETRGVNKSDAHGGSALKGTPLLYSHLRQINKGKRIINPANSLKCIPVNSRLSRK